MQTGRQLVAIALVTIVAVIASADVCTSDVPDDAEAIVNHMEFLGYRVEVGEQSIMVHHDTRYNFLIRKFLGGIMFNAFWGSSDYGKEHRNEFLEYVNDLNRMSSATVFYIDKDVDLAASCWFPGVYERQMYAAVIERWTGDLDFIIRLDIEKSQKLLE
jgi:hypothetical protein